VNFKAQNKNEYATSIIGSILNKCDSSVGVQIKVIFYDKARNILRVEDMWPASVNNIPAHSDYPFQIEVNHVENFDRVEVRVLAVNKW
jgi:hypothetical protein